VTSRQAFPTALAIRSPTFSMVFLPIILLGA
jgi:hypothetical protein